MSSPSVTRPEHAAHLGVGEKEAAWRLGVDENAAVEHSPDDDQELRRATWEGAANSLPVPASSADSHWPWRAALRTWRANSAGDRLDGRSDVAGSRHAEDDRAPSSGPASGAALSVPAATSPAMPAPGRIVQPWPLWTNRFWRLMELVWTVISTSTCAWVMARSISVRNPCPGAGMTSGRAATSARVTGRPGDRPAVVGATTHSFSLSRGCTLSDGVPARLYSRLRSRSPSSSHCWRWPE